jgi:hypothetical protein
MRVKNLLGPAATAYSNVSGALFGANGPSYLDVQQGAVGDCWLLSSLAEVAARDPQDIRNMFTYAGTTVENGATVGLFNVRLYNNGTPGSILADTELTSGATGMRATPVACGGRISRTGAAFHCLRPGLGPELAAAGQSPWYRGTAWAVREPKPHGSASADLAIASAADLHALPRREPGTCGTGKCVGGAAANITA